MTQKINDLAVFIEFIASSGLAIFFHAVLGHEDTAYMIFGVGLLLSLATFLLKEDIERTREKLLRRYDHAHEINLAVAQIRDPDGQAKAHEIIAGAKRTLTLLQQGYVPLDESEFYMKGAQYLNESQLRVKAVAPVTVGLDSRGVLVNYYQANMRAVERGVQITRIFVIDKEDLNDPEVQKVLLTQLRGGIEVRVAYRDELPSGIDISGRDTPCSFDFAIYDDHVATEVFCQPGKYFGYKTREANLLAKYQRLFELIEHGSHPFVGEEVAGNYEVGDAVVGLAANAQGRDKAPSELERSPGLKGISSWTTSRKLGNAG